MIVIFELIVVVAVISAILTFSDGGKKDKIAELYDTKYPCAFLRGLLEENREDESEAEFTFTVRQEPDYNKMLMKRPEVEE